ncbi:PREDICTED: calexcitin-2-like [Papilio xuthus]|uniref:Calexcitin-2 n=1 Tax=Papilio xuthus TaxID=66420 RepID=A0A194Q2F8_PAPXU|nr:PREDICTED: calexcitin-2-like [Papilio xuthus]KPI99726.1 Calexcitin-2 [Papilio xuthus]
MVSEFRKQKLLHLFNIFFDIDASGSIERNDFVLAAENICKLRGWKSGDDKYKETLESLIKIWEGLQTAADADKDGKVTADEWVAMWETYARNPNSGADWQLAYCKFMFQLEDAGCDGAIDSEEFSAVYESFGLLREDSVAAFDVMSKGKPKVTWQEFQELWIQYFTSDNPNDPGNFIFGAATF